MNNNNNNGSPMNGGPMRPKINNNRQNGPYNMGK
jgi:hypothetical protein